LNYYVIKTLFHNSLKILRDIRQGLLQQGRSDDTYMYDDSIGSNYSNVQRHWYDEPPYESDAEDFLMSGSGATAIIQVNFKVFQLVSKFCNKLFIVD
jgi:hypothetical protein